MNKRILNFLVLVLVTTGTASAQPKYRFQNNKLPTEQRVSDLIKQLTLTEKISLLEYNSPGVTRLNIPAYNWWNEALHGVARAGKATVFPQAIGLAATFDDSLIRHVADAISTEARAKYNVAIKNNHRSQYLGLTFWSPNINIFRDPRWGRGHETYGEDPYLSGTIGAAYVKGLQGSNPHYYKAVACAKHFAVHSGPEALRHEFNAVVSNSDLRNTYLPAFEKLVTEAKVGGLMCAYNRVDSMPCCSNQFLLQEVLRKEWHYTGYVVTDCWAVDDIFRYHKYVPSEEEAAALSIKAGVNVECGSSFKSLQKAVDKGLLTEADIDASLQRNLETLFKLGWFDPPASSPFSNIAEKEINSEAHRSLARKTAVESIVLLSNKNNTLPLKQNTRSLLVTGPNSDDANVLYANYNGNSGHMVTVLGGIVDGAGASTVVHNNKGCDLTDTVLQNVHWMIDDAEAVVAVMGLSPLLEGENGDAYLSDFGGDKKDITFPYAQLKYLRALRKKTKKPLIVVVAAGSALDLTEVEQLADAVLLCWYPGEQGGNAVADVLFGKANPSGRLPLTFYRSTSDLPPYEDYSMKGRTYRYFKGNVVHPFGYGLSYANFTYSNLQTSNANGRYTFTFDVKNSGNMDGDEVVQLYLQHINGNDNEPVRQLKNFKRVTVKKGTASKCTLTLDEKDFRYWDEATNGWIVYPGEYKVSIGGSSLDDRLSYMISRP